MSEAAEAGRQRGRVRLAWDRLTQLVQQAVGSFFADNCPRIAAAISYYGLFSVFPLAILLVVGYRVLFDDDVAREQVTDFLLRNLPLEPGEGRQDLGSILRSVTESPGTFGLVGLVGLIFSASGLMGAIRYGLNQSFNLAEVRPPAQGKLLDILLVFSVGMVVGVSLTVSFAARVALAISAELREQLGEPFALLPPLVLIGVQLIPLVLTFTVVCVLYKWLPPHEVRWRDVAVGAGVAALLNELAKNGFAFYLQNFADYSAIYGSLGTAIAFMFYVFLAANVFLLGAEVAAVWPAVRRGIYDVDDDRPWTQRALEALRGLTLGHEREADAPRPHPDPANDRGRGG